LHFILVVDFES